MADRKQLTALIALSALLCSCTVSYVPGESSLCPSLDTSSWDVSRKAVNWRSGEFSKTVGRQTLSVKLDDYWANAGKNSSHDGNYNVTISVFDLRDKANNRLDTPVFYDSSLAAVTYKGKKSMGKPKMGRLWFAPKSENFYETDVLGPNQVNINISYVDKKYDYLFQGYLISFPIKAPEVGDDYQVDFGWISVNGEKIKLPTLKSCYRAPHLSWRQTIS